MKYSEIKTAADNTIDFCEKYTLDYQLTGDFNPWAALTGTADKKQRLFAECIDYMESIRKLTDDFLSVRKKLL